MPSIVAPQPVFPCSAATGASSSPGPLAGFVKSPACSAVAPTRLQSPIQLPETAVTRPSAFLDALSARRRVKPSSRSPRQRRLLPRATPQQQSKSPPPFDALPWISALDAPPKGCIADFADLSQLHPQSERISSGPGPVRRRKTSLRSSPLRRSPEPAPLPRILAVSAPPLPRETLPPPTPAPRFNPSRTLFRHLMPVTPDPCQTVFSNRALFDA